MEREALDQDGRQRRVAQEGLEDGDVLVPHQVFHDRHRRRGVGGNRRPDFGASVMRQRHHQAQREIMPSGDRLAHQHVLAGGEHRYLRAMQVRLRRLFDLGACSRCVVEPSCHDPST
ncbi:hypothetical protein [Demequina litorisediminis]|uniref:hypothetical protein n=1 Tax=Demequina litorisediminis TaxID=1849022 RepID=UPI0024E14415|nr:hypothetical protein [Demequina litorisediminis]